MAVYYDPNNPNGQYDPNGQNGQNYGQNPYNNGVQYGPDGPFKPHAKTLNDGREFWVFLLLDICTFGIYGIVVMTQMTNELNTVGRRYYGDEITHYCVMCFILSWLTLGIHPLYWYHKFSRRVGEELYRRNIQYNFSATTFWLWCFLGSLFVVGPFIYMYKLIKAMNMINRSYNTFGR